MEIGRNPPSAGEAHLSSQQESQSKSKLPGGWRAIKYILGNESFEKLASMSLIANMTVYLRTRYNLSGIALVNVVTIWSGSTNVSSIAGAVISDAFLGRFLALLFGTICSLMGMLAMTLTAALPDLHPRPCQDHSLCSQPHKWQLAFLFSALGLIAVGAGGIRPCNIAFGADQFDTNTPKGRSQLESFFNWWYFSFTIALIIALTGVIYVQTNISWIVGFAIPTACLVVSITIFLFGRHTYVYKVPQGSVFVDMAKVVVAACRKRKLNVKSCDGRLLAYHDPWEASKLVQTERLKCLDRASMIADPTEVDCRGRAVNGWRLCTVHQVENLKCLVGVLPVWISGVACFVVMDQQSTFGVLQAIQMNRKIGKHFAIPPGWMGISSMIALSTWILLYEKLYIPLVKRVLKRKSRLSMQQRIGIGIVLSITCMIVAGFMEKKRRFQARNQGSFVSPLHVSALLPQFALSGLTEAFAAVALMEFYTIQLPESMRSVAGAIFFLSLSVASYFSSLIVNLMHVATRGKGKTPWLGGHDLNYNKLDNYYFIIAALGVIDLVYFILFARKYVMPVGKNVKKVQEKNLELGDVGQN